MNRVQLFWHEAAPWKQHFARERRHILLICEHGRNQILDLSLAVAWKTLKTPGLEPWALTTYSWKKQQQVSCIFKTHQKARVVSGSGEINTVHFPIWELLQKIDTTQEMLFKSCIVEMNYLETGNQPIGRNTTLSLWRWLPMRCSDASVPRVSHG